MCHLEPRILHQQTQEEKHHALEVGRYQIGQNATDQR